MKVSKSKAAILALCSLLLGGKALAQLDETEQAMIEWIDANANASIDLLEEIVNIGSGTMNQAGVRASRRT